MIYRALRRLTTLSDLVYALHENPTLLEVIGRGCNFLSVNSI
jgi:hypothetical protein